MKAVDEADLQKHLTEYLNDLGAEPILVTCAGRACAVLHNVEGDVESAELAHSAEFWQMIEQRRGEPTIPWENAKRELAS